MIIIFTTFEEFSRHLDTAAQVDTILLDFSKAFNKVPPVFEACTLQNSRFNNRMD